MENGHLVCLDTGFIKSRFGPATGWSQCLILLTSKLHFCVACACICLSEGDQLIAAGLSLKVVDFSLRVWHGFQPSGLRRKTVTHM